MRSIDLIIKFYPILNSLKIMGIIYAIVAALNQGIGYTILKKSNEEIPNYISFAFDSIFGILIWIPYALIVEITLEEILIVFPYAILSSILAEAFTFFVFSKCPLSLGNTIFATYPIFTILISSLFLKESLTRTQIILVILIVVGIIILSTPNKLEKTELKKSKTLLYPLLGAIFVGLSDTISKSILDTTSSQSFLFALGISQILISYAYLKTEKQNLQSVIRCIKNVKRYKFAIIFGLLISLSIICFWKAYEKTTISIASLITASYVAFTFILAIAFLKEKVNTKDTIGSILTITSIIYLSTI